MTTTEIISDIQANWVLYCAMPIVAATIGYVTKVVAIKMMFGPMNFVGIKPWLGWQGIVPRKAERMATTAVDTLTRDLVKPADIWAKLDPETLTKAIEQPMLATVEDITREVASKHQPGLWESLPETAKSMLIRRIQAEAPKTVQALMADMQTDIESVFDLKHMMVNAMTRDKNVLIKIFKETAPNEFRFIRNSGIYFGFGIGLLQAVAWALTHNVWVMPLFGGFVGWFSDWIALKMIFEPREPKRFLGLFTWQGLFQKRKVEVCEVHAKLIAENVVTAKNLFESAMTGPASDKLYELVAKHVNQLVDSQAGIAKPLLVFVVGSSNYQSMKQDIAEKLMEKLPENLGHAESYADQAIDIEKTLADGMKKMTLAQYENLLRPVFKEDEWALITVGAVLGFLVGELQVYIMLHGASY